MTLTWLDLLEISPEVQEKIRYARSAQTCLMESKQSSLKYQLTVKSPCFSRSGLNTTSFNHTYQTVVCSFGFIDEFKDPQFSAGI